MRNSKKLKLILKILICILIILIGVVGIYTKDGNMYIDLLPKYTLGSDIKGSTVLEFEVDDSTNTVYYDKNGKEVDSSEITEKNKKEYEEKQIPVNPEENLNTENYNKVKDIMEKRLKLLLVDQYKIDLNQETGKILLNVEDDYIEDIESILPMEGNLQLVESKTGDVIIDYTDFKSVEASYASLTNDFIIFMNLKLNNSGIKKINDIDKYKTIVEEEKVEEEKTDAEKKENKLIVNFDGDKLAEVSYDDILLNGKTLRVTVESGLTSDSQINSQLNLYGTLCKLADIGKMPVIYDLTAEEFVKNDIGNNINYIIISLIMVSVVVGIIFILKYKLNGLFATLGFATNIAIFLILVRLTKVPVSLNGFTGMFGLILLNMFLSRNILKYIKDEEKTFSENIKKAYLKTIDLMVIMLIIFVVFSFSSMTVINSMGLLLFWGWVAVVLGNLIFTVPMLSVVNKK